MKKSITLLLLAVATACTAYAAPVQPSRASNIAYAYVSSLNNAPASLKVSGVEQINETLYLVHFAPKGFALVSADDNAEPIMAYSLEGDINAKQMPANMAYMVGESAQAVKLLSQGNAANPRWTQIERGMLRSRADEGDVPALIQVEWNQPAPYNKYCPGEGNGQALVGCVAVAMSQAMSVQRYPDRAQGRVSYACPGYGELSIDFDKQNPYNWDAIIKGSNKYDEVARLLYHAGMSVQMGYGTDGSGIPSNQVYRISTALRENFGYPDAAYYWRSSYSGDWDQLLLNELYAGRAIVYNAIDSKGGYGHSFNVDGYQAGFYHINWGWGGLGNAMFRLDALKDGQYGYNYDSNHVAVIGIGGANSALKNIVLGDNTVEANQPAGTPVCTIKVNGEKPDLSQMSITITGEYDRTIDGYKESPFKYQDGLIVTTREIAKSEGSIYTRIQVTMKDASKTKLTQGFNIAVEDPKSIESKTSVSYDRNSKTFTVHTKFGATYSVKNANGAVVASGKITDDPEFTFNRSVLTAGNNTLEVSINGQTKTITLKL